MESRLKKGDNLTDCDALFSVLDKFALEWLDARTSGTKPPKRAPEAPIGGDAFSAREMQTGVAQPPLPAAAKVSVEAAVPPPLPEREPEPVGGYIGPRHTNLPAAPASVERKPERMYGALEAAYELDVATSQIYRWMEDGNVEWRVDGRKKVMPLWEVERLRAIKNRKPANRKSTAQWINKCIGAGGVRKSAKEKNGEASGDSAKS